MKKILLRIREGGGTLNDLAEELGISIPTLQAMIDFMENRGYLEKISTHCAGCPLSSKCFPEYDSTTKIYTLTPSGIELISEINRSVE
jgi:FeoC like transcriptional regulator.